MNIIESHGLGRRYGGHWALRDCTLAIPPGHVVALVGPNGAGKTTLLNLVVGLAVSTSGTITVLGGQPAARLPRSTALRSSPRTLRCTKTCPLMIWFT